ncbi:MAG: DUF4838 domain-containing protein [Clostridiaceae bacterium]|nr:DUF4838 domain-containing protein [Clostridiaceae bacterium]
MLTQRGLLIYPEEVGPYWRDLLLDPGLNLVGIHPAGGVDAARSLERLLEFVQTPPFWDFAHRLTRAGFSLEYEMHAMSWLVPRDLLAARPDWFRMNRQGERVNDFNLCPSNPDALAVLGRRAAELASHLPGSSNRFFFWLDDVKDAACHCPRCRHLTPSDQALILTNQMLRGVRTMNPAAKMSYLAYQDTLPVPVNVTPDSGVFLEFAPIGRDSSRPIGDPGCPQNAREAAPIDALLSFFGKEDSQVLEYWIDNSRFCNWRRPLKRLNLDLAVLHADVRFCLEKGFSAATSFACFLGEDYANEFGPPPVQAYARALSQND